MSPSVRILALGLISLAASASGAEAAELRLASDTWPPFTDVAGRPRVALDLVDEALRRIDVRSETHIVAFDAVIQGLGLGNFDGSAALWQDPQREGYLFFSAPYLENRLVLVGRKDADVSAHDLAPLAGARIAVVAGYSYGESVDGEAAPVFVEGASDQENLSRLLAGEVDYLLVDELLIRHVAQDQREDVSAHLEIGTHPLIVRPLHFALTRGVPGAEAIIAKFDAAIAGMVADGTFNRILGLQWIRTDVDGDGLLELVGSGEMVGPDGPEAGYDLAAAGGSTEVDRFWIEGTMYESWDDVPEQYRYRGPKDEPGEDTGMTLYRLEF